MGKFMVVHNNPGLDCATIQANWRKLANEKEGTWLRTYYNEEKGIRYCIWLAEGEKALERIFRNMDITWESVIPVEETVPDLWGEKWDQHLEADQTADNLGN